jgi:hypothetical protein
MLYLTKDHTTPPRKVQYGAGEVLASFLVARDNVAALASADIYRHGTASGIAPLGYTDWEMRTDANGPYFYREPKGTPAERDAASKPQSFESQIKARADTKIANLGDILEVTYRVVHLQKKQNKTPEETHLLVDLEHRLQQAHEILAEREALLAKADNVPNWSDKVWVPGDLVWHDGQAWVALPDVDRYPPDDVYDLATQTGGWAPL